jgi:predicted esterase
MVRNMTFVHLLEPAQAAGAPTLLLLHGTGGTEHDLMPIGRALAPTAGLLSPRGRVLENGMARFFRRLAEGVFDLGDLQQQTGDLADFVAAAAEQYGFAVNRVVAVGFSNGANIAASLLLLRPGVLAGAVLFRAMVPIVAHGHAGLPRERPPGLAHPRRRDGAAGRPARRCGRRRHADVAAGRTPADLRRRNPGTGVPAGARSRVRRRMGYTNPSPVDAIVDAIDAIVDAIDAIDAIKEPT